VRGIGVKIMKVNLVVVLGVCVGLFLFCLGVMKLFKVGVFESKEGEVA
jgi:hypothetical protein